MGGADDLFGQEAPQVSGADSLFAEEEIGAEKQLKFVMDSAVDEKPDRAARTLEIQQKTGVPKKFIDDNFDEIDRTARQADFDAKQYTKSNPKVSQWLLKNPDYAPLIREDNASMSSLEEMLRVAENTVRAVGAAPSRAGSGLWGVAQAGAEVVGADTLAGFFSEQRVSAAQIAEGIRGKQEGAGFVEKAALSGVESAATSLLMLPASIMTGSPAPMLVGLSAQTGGEAYGQARDKGRDVATSLGYGTSQAVIEYATELLPASKLLKDLIGDSGFIKTITNQLITEIPGEQVATILQDLNEWAILNPEEPFSSYLEERPSAAAQTLIATIVGTSAQTTVAYGGKKLVDHVEKRSAENMAKAQEDFFKALGETTTNSKLFEKLPGSYQQIIKDITKDGPVENVYTPVEFFQSHFQEQGIEPAQIAKELGFERQYQEAVNTGGKIAIPLDVYAKNLAPTEHNAVFAKELSFSADQMSARETEEFLKEAENENEPETDEFRTSLETVMTPIRDQLKSIYPADTADRNASVIEARLRTRAQRLGIDPQELMKRRPLSIVEGDQGKEGELFQSDVKKQPTWFSAVTKGIESAKQTKATSADWKAIVAKMEGVKKDEIEAVGLSEWLDIQKGPVTKEQVLEFVRANGVQVQEVTLGDDPEPMRKAREMAEADGNNWDSLSAADRRRYRQRAAGEPITKTVAGETKFESYQLHGGENYRELLLTLPVDIASIFEVRQKGSGFGVWNTKTEEWATTTLNKDVSEEGARKLNLENTKGTFKSGHFDEPNILAHVRFNERTDAEGKRVLFIEEVQSDWAQNGRKEGFESRKEKEWIVLLKDSGAVYRRTTTENEARNLVENQPELEVIEGERTVPATVPSAPFVTKTESWSMLAMKRMIRYAAENGFDRVAWTTGEQQADRYDLSKQVREIKADPHGDGKYTLELTMPDGGTKTMRNLAESDLEENIGKDLAKKIIEDSAAFSKAYAKYHDAVVAPGTPEAEMDSLSDLRDEAEQKLTYSGLDLKVGGSGMRAFYDQMLPQMVNKYVKKWGGKVGETEVVTEQAKEFTDGQVLSATTKSAHSLDITPAMRDAVMQGQPLFQGKDIKRGSISVSPTGDIIRLFKAKNLSTLLHELSHRWLFEMQDDASMPEAPQQIKDDLAATLKYLGVESVEELDITKIKKGTEAYAKAVAANEKFAQTGEAYFMEGKAPSTALRRVFATLKAWMVAIYKALKQGRLDAEMTPEMRGVFDRLLATDEEIEAATAQANAIPAFTTAVDAGMTDTEFAAYSKTVEDANREAREELDAKVMKEYKKTLTDIWKEEKTKVQSEVEAELDKDPIYSAMAKMKENGIKIAISEAGALPRSFTAKDGIPADMAAEMLGFTSGEAMVKALVSVEARGARAARETNILMDQRFGNLLTDGTLVEEARKAVMGDGRAKIIEAEIKALNKKAREVKPFVKAKDKANKEEARAGRDLYKALVPKLANVRDHAATVIAGKPIRELRPMQYYNAARQASREAVKDVAKKDYLMAGYNKGRELLNLELYREAVNAKDMIEDGNQKLQKVFVADIKQSKSRNMDMVNAARAILASHGLGKTDAPPSSYLDKMRQYDPEVYENLRPIFEPAIASMKPFKEMTVEEYIGMRDAVFALMKTSRRSKQMEIDGKLIERDEAVANLVNRMMDLDKGKSKELRSTLDDLQKTKIGLLSAKATLRRVESWVTAMDGGPNGAFRKYIWNPVSDAVNQYRDKKREVVSRYLEIVQEVAPTIKPGDIEAPELGFKFRGKNELLHALLHTGNESNKAKLLIGYGWGERSEEGVLNTAKWDAFEKRMRDQGKLTKADYDFAQNVWNMMEGMKPTLQEAHHRMYGYYFNEVTANEFTNEFGTYRGGYVPAKVDVNVVQEAEQRKDAEEIVQGQNSFAFPTSGKGATMSRVDGYARPLQLDMRTIPAHIDWAMRFAYLEPAVKDVARVVLDRDFAKSMNGLDPTTINHMLVPWLQRTAQQITSTRGMNKWADKFWTGVRSRTGMQVMVLNVINTLQQYTGLTIAFTRVKPSNIRSSFWSYMTKHKEFSEEISERSAFMRNRVFTSHNEVMQTIDDLLLNPSKYEKAKDFATKHGYFMQQATQGFVDQVVWHAAYSESLSKGQDDKESVRHADSVVRETQGSFAPEDISRFEAGTPFVRAFSMFYNYFNMQANLLGTEFSNIASNKLGLRKGAGRALYVYTFAFMIPAYIGGAIIRVLVAGGADEDDDDEYQDDLIRMFFGSQFEAATAMVPVAGPLLNTAVNQWNKKWYDDKITVSPAVTAVESSARAPYSVYKAIVEDGNEKRAVKDVLYLIGMATGLPAGALGRPLGYLADVHQGKANPEGPLDVARGLISGQDVNR